MSNINIKIETLKSLLQDMEDKKREMELAAVLETTHEELDDVLLGVGLYPTEIQKEAIFNFVVEKMGEGL